MPDERLIEIETRIAHQEHTIAELNDALSSQQAQIAKLESLVNALRERVRALSDSAPGAGASDEIPPHY
ncbi:MAG: SlyX family protein [Proteobacteria bacterium]|nr:SlyX family protein [Pseudomonadota bacterium]MDA0992439.1 SlyX family protein [Pseudomonadota bacterium]